MRHRSEWFLSDPTGLVTVKCRPSSMVMPVMSPSSLEPPSSPNPMSGKGRFPIPLLLVEKVDFQATEMALCAAFLQYDSKKGFAL